jgi:hypothetical protein
MPSNRTDPDVAAIKRSIARASVLFPEPDSPTRPTISRGATLKLTS